MKENPNLNSVRFCVLLALPLLLGGCGGASKPFPVVPPTTGSEFVLAASNNQILAYSVNLSTGALGQPMMAAGPSAAAGMVASPSGKFVYAADGFASAVDVFSLNSTTGALAAISGSPVSLGALPFGIAMDSAGKFLYAPEEVSAGVGAFTVNSSTGVLAAVTGSPFATGNGPARAVVDPSGKFLYVSDSLDANGGISAYTINSTSGALTAIAGSPFATLPLGGPAGVTVSPNGKFLYVCEFSLDEVLVLPINANGSLGSAVGFPSLVGNHPVGIAVNSAGTFLYVANSLDATISVFSINSGTGALTAITGSPFAAGATVSSLVIDPSGKYLYVTNPVANTITGFNINATSGAPTQFASLPVAAGTQPTSLTVAAIP
jgi:6-phosphogluconolactonase